MTIANPINPELVPQIPDAVMIVISRRIYGWDGGHRKNRDIKRIFPIGDITIVEYHDHGSTYNGRTDHYETKDEITYAVFVGERYSSHIFHDIDRAVAHALAFKYDGINTRADRYFMRGIGATTRR